MNYDTIIRLIILIGIIQGFVFNFFVFFNRKKINVSIKYLNIVVLCLSLNNIREFVFDGDYISGVLRYLYLAIPWHFLIVPFFYIFLIHYLKITDKYSSYLKLTLIIFVIEISLRLGLIVLSNDLDTQLDEYIIIEEMCNAVYSVFIFYHIMKLVFFDKEALIKMASYDNVNWIKITLKFGIAVMVLWIFAVIYYYFTRNAWIYDPLKIIYSVLIYWLGYQGLINSKRVTDRIYLRRQIENKGLRPKFVFSENSENVRLDEKHKSDFKIIKSYIVNHQRFLDPLFSLEKLSEELNFSTSHLSKVINTYSSYNFSDFINLLRVEQAKNLLVNKEFNQYTIVAIGLECGFNSKSTFYTAFKKFTSQTPSGFRMTL